MNTKTIARVLAAIIALLFLFFGARYYFAPTGILPTAGFDLAGVDVGGLSTTRAIIGASFLTFGILIVMHSVRAGEDGAMRFAVLFLLLSVIGRVISMFADGSNDGTVRNLIPVSLMLVVSIASVILFNRGAD